MSALVCRPRQTGLFDVNRAYRIDLAGFLGYPARPFNGLMP